MYNAFASDCKQNRTVVKVFLANGGCITGRIDQVGSEAIVMANHGGGAEAHHEERHRQHLPRQCRRAMR